MNQTADTTDHADLAQIDGDTDQRRRALARCGRGPLSKNTSTITVAMVATLAGALWMVPIRAQTSPQTQARPPAGAKIGEAPLSYRASAQNDTLWDIARVVAPAGVSPNQVMVAIVRRNAEAFAGGNMFFMRVGAPLVLPSLTEVRAENEAQALATIERHRSAWRAGRAEAPALGPAPALPADTQAAGAQATAAAPPAAVASTPGAGPSAAAPGTVAPAAAPPAVLPPAATPPSAAVASAAVPATGAPAATPATPTSDPVATPQSSGLGATVATVLGALLVGALALWLVLRPKRPPERPSERSAPTTGVVAQATAGAPPRAAAGAGQSVAARAGAALSGAPGTSGMSGASTASALPASAGSAGTPAASPGAWAQASGQAVTLLVRRVGQDEATPSRITPPEPGLELLVARAYLAMGRSADAQEWLHAVAAHGPEPLQQEAARLLG